MFKPYDNPELKLFNAMYDLRFVCEVGGADTEPAVIGQEIMPECSVIKDEHTGDRIVVTAIPDSPDDFKGAAIWLSNPEVGVAIDAGQWQTSPYDVIFWVSEALQARYYNPSTGARVKFDSKILANRISYPTIKPIPQSETDPRDLPGKIECITVPQTDSYTYTSRIVDIGYEDSDSQIAERFGIVQYNQNKSTTFDVAISEIRPTDKTQVIDEFDREFELKLRLGQRFNLLVKPWGQPTETYITGNNFRVKVVREGLVIYGEKADRQIGCMPSKLTTQFINNILEFASSA